MLHAICQQIWKTQQWAQDWKMLVFVPIPKKVNAKEYSNYCKIALISHVSKVMLKILQARLQQYMKQELPRCTNWVLERQRNQSSNFQHLLDHGENKEIPEKHLLLLHWLFSNLWLCGSQNLWKILKEMGMPEHLTVSWETCMRIKKQQLEPNMKKLIFSQLGKE